MVRSKDELIATISNLLEDDSDDKITLLEDISDTYDSFNDTEDWKTKYEENDREWRRKYVERFNNKVDERDEEYEEDEEEIKTYDDLFKEV